MKNRHSERTLDWYRKPTQEEVALLYRLLEAGFRGQEELVPLVRGVLVRSIDSDGGLELYSQLPGSAPVLKRIPVEAEGKDEDGVTIHILLHVVDGRPV